jgi:signal transduction histidine kinase
VSEEAQRRIFDRFEQADAGTSGRFGGTGLGLSIARELVATVRNNVTIDWTLRENVRAQLRVLVKRILRKHGYPPDKRKEAVDTVIEQAEQVCREWVEAA